MNLHGKSPKLVPEAAAGWGVGQSLLTPERSSDSPGEFLSANGGFKAWGREKEDRYFSSSYCVDAATRVGASNKEYMMQLKVRHSS